MVDWNPFSDESWDDDRIWSGDKPKIRNRPAKAQPPEPLAPEEPPEEDARQAENEAPLRGFTRGRPAFMDIPKGFTPPAKDSLPEMPQPRGPIPFVDAPAAIPKPKPPPPPKGKKRILIIDDNMMIRRNYKLFLEKLGFEVIEAVDGRNGLDKMKRYGHETISLVIVDLNMPVMSGEEFVTSVKSSFAESLPPVWVCTVSAEAPVVKSLAAKGISGYLLKPVQFRTFATKLQALFPDIEVKIP